MKKTLIPITVGILACILLMAGMWVYYRAGTREIDLREIGSQENYDRHYVLIADDIGTSLWTEVYESARKEAQETGVYLELLDSNIMSDYTVEDYLRISIASKVDGIIMQPGGNPQVRGLISQAAQSGIPVVTALEDDSESERISFVGINSYQMGAAYGEEVLKLLPKGKSNVLILLNANTKDTGTNLVLSQISSDVKEKAGPDQEVEISSYEIDISENFDSDEAIRDIFVNRRPIPDVLVCLDEVISECAYQAVVDYNQVGNVNVIGYYTSDSILDAIRRGTVAATVTFSTEEIGRYSVDALNEYHSLGHVSNYFNVGLHVVNEKNVDSFSHQTTAQED